MGVRWRATPGIVLTVSLVVAASACGREQDSNPSVSLNTVAEDGHRARQERRLHELEAQLARRRKTEAEEPADAKATDGENRASLTGFDQFAQSLPGQAGVAVAALGHGAPKVVGTLTSGSAWSTIKLPIALQVIADAGGPQSLGADQTEDMSRALTASDNAAAARLFASIARRHGGQVGAATTVSKLLAAGGSPTTVSTEGRAGFSSYGQTEWALGDQARFMAGVAGSCTGSAAADRFVLDQMGRVTSDRWGLGTISGARWKGGWGPGVDGKYLARQVGVIPSRGGEVAVAIAGRANDGSFEGAQRIASQAAAWVGQHVPALGRTEC